MRAGDRVWGLLGRKTGSMAEYVAVRPRHIAPAPENLTPEQAVSPLAGGATAVTALREKAVMTEITRYAEQGDLVPVVDLSTPSTGSPTPTGPWKPVASAASTSSGSRERANTAGAPGYSTPAAGPRLTIHRLVPV